MFKIGLTLKFGDILWEGGRSLVDCLLQLFQARLLPQSLMEGKDYIESGGKVDLYKEALPRDKEDGRLTESLQVRIKVFPIGESNFPPSRSW